MRGTMFFLLFARTFMVVENFYASANAFLAKIFEQLQHEIVTNGERRVELKADLERRNAETAEQVDQYKEMLRMLKENVSWRFVCDKRKLSPIFMKNAKCKISKSGFAKRGRSRQS